MKIGRKARNFMLTRIHRHTTEWISRGYTLFFILSLVTVFGFFALIPSVTSAIQEEKWITLSLLLGGYGVVLIIMLIKNINYYVRSYVLCFAIALTGYVSMSSIGLISSARLWFLCSAVLACLLIGVKSAVAVFVISFIVFAGFGYKTGFEIKLPSEPDHIVWIITSSTFVFVNIIVVGATYLIVSGLKKAEISLRQSEEKYRMLVENQTDLVVKVDKEGRFVYVSPSYCNTFGKPEKELIGNTFFPLVHEEDVETTKKEMEKLYSPPYSCYIEQRAMTKDGWRWFGWTDTAELNSKNEVASIIGVGRDITEKKIADNAVAESEKVFRSAVNEMKIGMAVHEMIFDENENPKDYRFKEINTEFETMTGLNRKEIIGKTCLEVLPGTERFWIETFGRVAREGISVTFENFASQLNKWFRVYAYRTRENEFAAVFDDITERKRYEEEIRLKMKELQDMNSIMIDRELKMTELKEEINELLKELGREKKY